MSRQESMSKRIVTRMGCPDAYGRAEHADGIGVVLTPKKAEYEQFRGISCSTCDQGSCFTNKPLVELILDLLEIISDDEDCCRTEHGTESDADSVFLARRRCSTVTSDDEAPFMEREEISDSDEDEDEDSYSEWYEDCFEQLQDLLPASARSMAVRSWE
mmetsp:Transcript_92078/g.265726  ORF Transcript_92078/g.265726 Transcript_92078/m.265726 type:complete len:159 (+) Transcript_92078:309-785(+)